jgi:hypothetical protein
LQRSHRERESLLAHLSYVEAVEGGHHDLVDAVVGHVDRSHAEDGSWVAVPPREPVRGSLWPFFLLLLFKRILLGYRCTIKTSNRRVSARVCGATRTRKWRWGVMMPVLSNELNVRDRDVGALTSAILTTSSSTVESEESELLKLGCDRLRFPSMPPPVSPPSLSCICKRCERDRALDCVAKKCDRLRPVFRTL